jgi:hypothetical protein
MHLGGVMLIGRDLSVSSITSIVDPPTGLYVANGLHLWCLSRYLDFSYHVPTRKTFKQPDLTTTPSG